MFQFCWRLLLLLLDLPCCSRHLPASRTTHPKPSPHCTTRHCIAGHAQQQGLPAAERAAGAGRPLGGAQHHAEASLSAPAVGRARPAAALLPALGCREAEEAPHKPPPPSALSPPLLCSKIATNLKVFGSCEEVVEQTLTLFQVCCGSVGASTEAWRKRLCAARSVCPLASPPTHPPILLPLCRTWRRGT